MKAKFVKKLNRFTGDAALYHLDPPMDTEYAGKADFVVVSATIAYSGPETYIFPATSDGVITDWTELDGSYQGGMDHGRALEDAGYTLEKTS